MPDKTPAEKLKYKPGMTAAVLHAPAGVGLGLPAGVASEDANGADFIVVFAATQAEADGRVSEVSRFVGEKTVAWIAYPKGAKARGLDISRDTISAFVRRVGLIVNANFSIDETWSALRVRPLRPGE
jgi:hypothetical protein